MYYVAMQLIIKVQKFIILSVLSCSLIIAWFSGNIEGPIPPTIYNTNTDEVSNDEASNDSLWSSISRDLKLDHQTQSARVQAEIHKILADQGRLNQILKAAETLIILNRKYTISYQE